MKTRSILRKKLSRQIASGWKQFLAIILMGGIAMTLFVGLLSNAQSLSNRAESFYSQGNVADIWVMTSSFDEDDEFAIRDYLDEGDDVQTRFELTASLEGRNSYGVIYDSFPRISKPVELLATSASHSDSNFLLIDKGRWYGNGSSDNPEMDVGGHVKVSYNVMALKKAMDLDDDYLDMLDGIVKEGGENIFRKDDISCTYEVTGVMTYPENITLSSYSMSSYLMSKQMFRDSIEELLDSNFTVPGSRLIKSFLGFDEEGDLAFPQPNQYLINLEDKSSRDTKEENIKQYFESKDERVANYAGMLDRELNPWSIEVDSDIKQATQLTFVFPMVFFLVAILVILTTISQIIIKERGEIGTMKAIGLSNKEIYWHYISLSLALISIGVILGFILGPLIIPGILGFKYSILYCLPPREVFVFPLWQAFASAAIFLAAGALVTFLLCRKTIRLLPAASMRPEPIQFKALGKTSSKKRGAIALSIKMAFRNIRVNLAKSIMVVVGVMGCTALLVCGYGIEDTINYGLDMDLASHYGSDILVGYSSPLTQGDGANDLLAIEGISKVQEYYSSMSTISNKESGMSTDSSFYLLPDDCSYYFHELPEKGEYPYVGLTDKPSQSIGVKVGDLIVFTVSGEEYLAMVHEIFPSFSCNGVYGRLSDFEVSNVSSAWVDLEDGADIVTVQQRIKDTIGYASSYASRSDTVERVNGILSGIKMMTNAVKVFAILLALVVLYNLCLLNFRERTRDIATLKVLGFSMVEIAWSLILETMILTAVGVLLGSFAGYPFMFLTLYVNRVSLVDFIYHIYPLTYLISFALTFVVSFLVNLYFSTRTRKIQMIESLKSVE